MKKSMLSRRTWRQAVISAVGSVKVKLLVSCCILLLLLAFTTPTPSFFGWNHRSDALLKSSFPKKGYTLLINTWKRNDLLKKSISHYASCPGLQSIHIVWSEPDPPSDSIIEYLNHVVQLHSKDDLEIELKFDINKEDSLNNRFKEIKDLRTDVVFSIDDDVIFPCASVELAFSVWRSAPDTMVGFVPRVHWVDESEGNQGNFIYGGWWSVWWTGTYSMVLSKAALFHKKYLSVYTYEMPASIRDYVTKNRNCEDIAMSFLVANATGAPPIWVEGVRLRTICAATPNPALGRSLFAYIGGKIFEIGSTGISSLGGHSEKRSECVNRFVAEFGRMPLVSTTVKALDSRKSWVW